MADLQETLDVILTNDRRITVTPDNQSTCRSCGEVIIWCITKNGKKMPVDPPEADEETTTSHFATCKDADQWRKK